MRKAVSTAEKRPAYSLLAEPSLEVHTHKHEEGINVVRVVRNHVFIMTEDTLLHIIPGFERRTTLEVGEFSEMIVD